MLERNAMETAGTASAWAPRGADDGVGPRAIRARLLLVDDHAVFREGLRLLLGHHEHLSVVAEAACYSEAVAAVRVHEIDVAILDLSMPGRDGVELIDRLRSMKPNMRILVLSASTEAAIVARALRARIHGYIAKDSAGKDVVVAIQHAMEGRRYLCATITAQVMRAATDGDPGPCAHESLTAREFKIFQMLVNGKRAAQIADELFLSVKTISTHKSHILQKLGLKSGAELLRYALRNHLTAM